MTIGNVTIAFFCCLLNKAEFPRHANSRARAGLFAPKTLTGKFTPEFEFDAHVGCF